MKSGGVAVIAIILAGYVAPVRGQQKPASKAATTKKKTVPDFSVLTAFEGALLDLKGAVETGVNREDYQRKLQTAAGESLKADARLPDDEDKPGIVRQCLRGYTLALDKYRVAAIVWDINLSLDKLEASSGIDRPADSEDDLKRKWAEAGHALDEARACKKQQR